MPPTERRCLAEADLNCEARSADGASRPLISGYAAVFNSPSEILASDDAGSFREIIRPGAFSRSLMGGDIRALINHQTGQVLGRTKSGTLRLVQDARGLKVEIDPPDTQAARDLMESMRRGDVSGMSFRFMTPEGGDSWGADAQGFPLRELRDVEIDEVSIVTFPAYKATEVSVRSLEALESHRRSQPRQTPSRDRAERLLRLALAD